MLWKYSSIDSKFTFYKKWIAHGDATILTLLRI